MDMALYVQWGVYKLAMNLVLGQVSSSENLQKQWWDTLWKAKIPSKIKLFI